jgi:opacity protein-like surface antigen
MRRIGLLLAAAGALLATSATAAQAAQLNGCTGSGRVLIPAPGHPGWNVDGAGSCPVQTTPTAPFTAREPTTVRFTGAGTSDSLGVCSGSLLVTNLKLNVTMTYTGAVTGTTRSSTRSGRRPSRPSRSRPRS